MEDFIFSLMMFVIAFFILAIVGFVLFQRYGQRHAERNFDAIIYETFNGKNVASYKIPRFSGSLPYHKIVNGAHMMGFRLVNETRSFTGVTLTFQRV